MKQFGKKSLSLENVQWLLYIVGTFGYMLLSTTLLAMHLYRYDPGEPNPYGWPILASSALVGVAALLGRAVNPFVSIGVGHISDQTYSQWGRRRPFMAIAILPMLIGFVLVFAPPRPYASPWNAVHLTLMLIVFFVSLSTYMTPYQALFVEIADTTQQRLHLSTLLGISNLLGNAVGLIAAPWLVEHWGFLNMAFIVSGIGLISLVMPLAIREDLKLPNLKPLPFWNSLQTVGQNSTFKPYLASLVLLWIATNVIFICSNYFVVALLHRDIGFSSVVNGAIVGGAIVGLVPVHVLASRWGKKATLRFSLTWLGCNLLAIAIWPLWTRDNLWLCLALFTLFGTAMSAILILPNAILADIIDEDAKQTGTQRGAIYFGTSAMVMTLCSGVSSILTGGILMLGKTPVQPLGVQLIYLVAGLLTLGAAWVLSFYPLEK